MIQRLCDVCGKVTDRNYVTERFKGISTYRDPTNRSEHVKVEVEIMVGINGTRNDGDICKGCLIDAVAYHDDRPEEGCG